MATAADRMKTQGNEQQNLMVALRIRPMNPDEILQGAVPITHKVDDNMVVLRDPAEDPDDILRANRSREKQYVFDKAFDGGASQEDVFEKTTKFLIKNVINGFNATVFAYGATGAGKTYTMLGTDHDPGIMALTLNCLFGEMEKTREDMSYKVTMSYLEIYNEMIKDLLNPISGYLELREDSKGVQIPGLSEVTAKSTHEVMSMLMKGNKERTQEPTAANKTSSRSHAVLQVLVRQRNRVRHTHQEVRTGKLFLIDLAGSERASNTQNRGKRMVEGAHINRSLLALGNCINALSDRNGHKYVNYRDSKLTRILKDSLGGNTKTVMIAHISPASIHFEESRNTLVYADRAKKIKTKVRRNVTDVSYHIAQYTSIIDELKDEVHRLRKKLEEAKNLNKQGVSIHAVQSEVMEESMKEERAELKKLKEQLLSTFRDQMELRRSLMELNNTAMEISLDTHRHSMLINDWEAEKARTQRRKSSLEPDDNKYKEDLEKEKEKESEESYSLEPEDVHQAREELRALTKEKQRLDRVKVNLAKELENAKVKSQSVEQNLPKKINSSEHQEILLLLCRVHELEMENTEMESACLVRDHEAQMKELKLARFESQKNLADEIIQQQRALIDENNLECPQELEELYEMYQDIGEEMFNPPSHSNSVQNLSSYKSTSISNMNRKFLEAESMTDTEKGYSHKEEHNNTVFKRDILKKSSEVMASHPEEKSNEKMFTQSPKVDRRFGGVARNKEHTQSLTSLDNAPSIAANNKYLPPDGTSGSNNNNHLTVPRKSSDPQSHSSIPTSATDRGVIATNTRSIAAKAAKKRNKAQVNTVNTERLQATHGSVGKLRNVGDAEHLPHLTESRLANHNRNYGGSTINMQHFLQDDQLSNTTLDKLSVVTDGSPTALGAAAAAAATAAPRRQEPRAGPPRKGQKRADPVYRKRRTKSHDNNFANYQQMTPEAFYKQLAKAGPASRRQLGEHTSMSTPSKAASEQRFPPAKNYSRANHKAQSNLTFPDDGYSEGAKELEMAETPPITVHQRGVQRGKGLSVQKKVRGPNLNGVSSDSSTSSTPQGISQSKPGSKPPPSIPAYRKGDMSITGFSLK